MRRALVVLLLATAPVFADVPTLVSRDDSGAVALRLEALRVHVLIRAHLSRTTFDLTFRNDLDRELEGDFTFPLGNDAEVSDVGLYINGKLRHAVAVERLQARAAYMQTVHRRVDPILAEWNPSTRAFRFRVYPIPARGTKMVRIAYDRELTSSPYELDLRYDMTVASLDVTIDSDTPVRSDGLALRRSGDRWTIQETNVALDGVIRAARADNNVALTAWSAAEQLWYASAAIRTKGDGVPMAPASHVTLLVDTSGSAAQRDAAKLQAFLAAFLARQEPSVVVDVVPFHVDVEPAQRTSASGLEPALTALTYSGATNLAGVLERLPKLPLTSRIVLVSDGMESVGDAKRLARALAGVNRPITVVNASPQADDLFLGRLARMSGGWFVDLTRDRTASAVDAVMQQATRTAIASARSYIRDIVPAVLTSGLATVNVRSREQPSLLPLAANGERREYLLHQLDGDQADLVRRAWARARLRELLDQHGSGADAVLEHGKRFRQITPRTSLLVLESWQDYERYGIPLPPDLEAEKQAHRAIRWGNWGSPGTIDLAGKSNEAPPPGAAWFLRGTVAMDGDGPLPGVTITLRDEDRTTRTVVSNEIGQFLLTAPQRPRAFTLRAELPGLGTAEQRYPRGLDSGTIVAIRMNLSSVTETITVTAESPYAAFDAYEEISAQPAVRMVMAAPQTGDKQRIAERALALRDESPELAVRALTDLAEAYPDDAAILRIVARLLQAWDRADLAKLFIARTIELAPNEPQNRHEVTSADASLHVELLWDSNYTDVDLHVLEPGGEEVFHGHLQGKTGGRLHHDVTSGYGPETYTHPSPTRGTYDVTLTYYNADNTGVSLQTLAHVIIWRYGERQDYLVTLTKENEKRVVARVTY